MSHYTLEDSASSNVPENFPLQEVNDYTLDSPRFYLLRDMTSFYIRPASTAADDGLRLLKNFDSQLPWLATVGSAAQWGSTPLSGKDHLQVKYRTRVEQSELEWDRPWSESWTRAYIAEAEVHEDDLPTELRELAVQKPDGIFRVPVAAMILAGASMDYVRSILPKQDENDPFIYLAYLLSDRRTRPLGKGAGAELILHAKNEARALGLRRICSDCWRGNDRKLVGFYESQGFRAIGDFVVEEKNDWPGAVLEMRL